MRQNVILNKIRENCQSKLSISDMLQLSADEYFKFWNDCVNEVATEFRNQGLEDSAKEAEKWIEKRYE